MGPMGKTTCLVYVISGLMLSMALAIGPCARIASGQQKPRADVVETPAIGEGLCVSNLFQSHMVIQRDKPIRVWGWASANERVTVALGGAESSAVAGEDRSWQVTLPAVPANSVPQTMTIRGAGRTLTLENVLIGDVWVLGGQSNMEFEISKVENGQLEIVSANFPRIRILTVPYGQGPEVRKAFARLDEWSDWFKRHFRKGYWEECSPRTVQDLSAIGYVFARRLHMATEVPIGVIDASRGGTTVEAWTPLSALRSMESPRVRSMLARWDTRVSEWDARQDLDARVAQHRQRVERLKAEGKPVPSDMVEPTDLRPGPLGDPNHPGGCYAGMIGPLQGLSVRGAIFHQGFNNALDGYEGAMMYRDVFPGMIRSWRQAFDDPGLPFGILSLCTAGEPQTLENYVEKMYDAGIYIREAQYQTFLEFLSAGDANVGYASTFDLRRSWYHPQLKIPAGERMARWALATQYGMGNRIVWKPPMIESMEVREGSIVLRLDTGVGDPESGAMRGFSIAGEDRRFQPAVAAYLQTGVDERGRPRYDRKQLVLSSPLVPRPLHYRYAWGRSPLANVQAEGNRDLPLATQRSDTWHMEEVPRGVLEGPESPSETRARRTAILEVLKGEDLRRRLFEARELIRANSPPDPAP